MIKNKQGHMTKMAAMPIYGKTNLQKSSSQVLLNLLQRNLILQCKYKS